jgi:hypothetical protein
MEISEERTEEIIDLLHKILDKIDGQRAKETAPFTQNTPPLSERKRAPRYPLREDPGTIFRSRGGYKWQCPYCLKPIVDGDMIVAFQPKPEARTTYAHLSCDEEERNMCHAMDI